ncbi:hypothetical protein ACIO3O_19600 [Streptomyces sp. NPDC087440]|uniref:hypothetical protein n=1 Tax=Streptomyces sp. NPDC087440 TaxID=3365790 RepID=UPI003804BA77
MTVSVERPLVVAGTAVQQHSMVDPYDEPHTTVALRVTVSRDHLAAAVEMGGSNYYGTRPDPDRWTVAEIRYFAEFQFLAMGLLELQQGAEAVAEMAAPDFHEPDTRAYILAVYRAVDRAYPKAGAREA